MANPDHIAQLMKGVAAWNAWRDNTNLIEVDLSRADLSRADLTGANLSGGYHVAADRMIKVNLSRANLTEADLIDADLRGTNLSGAKLDRANLETETVSLLAHMARFIIAELTDPSSIPNGLEAIVPHLTVPVQPLLQGSSRPFAMFKDYWKYDWVLPVYRYETRSARGPDHRAC
jgi:uncharacterized protein YjbI with pentapeptide repeats